MRFLALALVCAAARGQTTRVLQLTQNESPRDLQEIAGVLRAGANISQVSVDDGTRRVTVNGTDAQIATAGWLVQQLDLPSNAAPSGVYEHPAPGGGEVVRVFYVTHASTPRQLQGIAVTVRVVADIGPMFVYNALRALVVRGSSRQIGLAAWLVDQLNLPADVAAPAPHEFQFADDDVAQVFELRNSQTPEQMQEIVTMIRSLAEVMRMMADTDRHAIALRASAGRVALAAWLVDELDKPAGTAPGNAAHQYQVADGADNQVRVFYLAGAQTGEKLAKAAGAVHTGAGIKRVSVYHPLGALALRGTAGEVATAEKVLAAMGDGSTPVP